MHIYAVGSFRDTDRAAARGYWGVVNPPPPTFLESTYSENRVGHSENVVKQRKYYKIVLSL
jgi:hypothetical protein